MYYGPQIIISTGITYGDFSKQQLGLLLNIPLAVAQAVGSSIATIIIDKLGRRYLMLRTLPGACLSLVLTTISMGLIEFAEDE